MAVFLLHHLLSLIYCVTFVSSMRRGFGQTYDQTYDQTHDQTYDQISDQTSDQGHILSPIHDQPEQENNILDDNFGSTRTNVGESARFSIDFNKEMKYEDFSDTDSSNAYTIELQNTLLYQPTACPTAELLIKFMKVKPRRALSNGTKIDELSLIKMTSLIKVMAVGWDVGGFPRLSGRSVSRRGAKKAAGSSRQNHGEGYGNEASHGGTTYEHLGQGLHGLYPGYQSPFPETLKLIQASLNNQTQNPLHPPVVNSGGCRGRGKCTIM